MVYLIISTAMTEGFAIVAVHQTKEGAEAHLNRFDKWDRSYMSIEEWELEE